MNNELLVISIRELCKKHNIAISKLEGDLNFGSGLISRWSKNSPSIDKIVAIADYFHISLDEVIGHNQDISDEFLNILYKKTLDKTIIWEDGRELQKNGIALKIYTDFCLPENSCDDQHVETIYAANFHNGYIIIYAYHFLDKILNPRDIILFVQPSNDSSIVKQYYDKKQLMKLWIKILNSLGDKAPDIVKAEDLKNEFISEFSKKTEKDTEESNKNISISLKTIKSQEFITIKTMLDKLGLNTIRNTINEQFNSSIFLTDSEDSVVKIIFDDILYILKDKRKCNFVYKDYSFTTNDNFEDLYDILKMFKFIRPNHNYIINPKAISTIDKSGLEILDGTQILFSAEYKAMSIETQSDAI